MKIGILINSAWPTVGLLDVLGQYFQANGIGVVWLIESRLPVFKHKLSLPGKHLYLTDFLRDPPEIDYSHYQNKQINHLLFSDFDRSVELRTYQKKKFSDPNLIPKIIRYFENSIKEEDLSLILYENVSNTFAYCAYYACQELGIKYYGLMTSRIPGRFEIWEDPFGGIENLSSSLHTTNSVSPEAEEYLNKLLRRTSAVKPDYVKHSTIDISYSYVNHYALKLDLIGRYLAFQFSKNNDLAHSFQTINPYINATKLLMRNIMRRYNIIKLNKLLERPLRNDEYYIYPLHFHPESSTSVLSPQYVDEDVLIKNIAFQLPFGKKLYVKDHPQAVGFKPLDFYERIRRLPNVRLIHYAEDVQELIQKSKGVITLTSTMGYEALLLGKAVFCLGDVFYLAHPHCKKVNTISDLFNHLRNAENYTPNYDYTTNLNFIEAYYKNTYQGSLLTPHTYMSQGTFSENLVGIGQAILSKYNNQNERIPLH